MNNSPSRAGYKDPRAMLVLLCSIFLVSSGCTTTRSFSSADAIEDELRPGDDVTLVLNDGRNLELSVTGWNGERLDGLDHAGLAHTVASRDIAHMDVTRNSPLKTALLIGVVSSMVLVMMIASAYGDFLSGLTI